MTSFMTLTDDPVLQPHLNTYRYVPLPGGGLAATSIATIERQMDPIVVPSHRKRNALKHFSQAS